MDIINPQPLWLPVLSIFLPGVYYSGRAAALRSGVDRGLAGDLAPGLGIALVVAVTHLVAYLSGSFVLGAALSLGTVGLTGWLLWLLGREGGAVHDDLPKIPASNWRWPVALAVTLLAAPAALGWAFHDELFFTGHMSITAQLQNGHYPPEHLTFPQFELRYHYGFNILCALLTGLTRMPIDWAIDTVTLAAWFYLGGLIWRLGERLYNSALAGGLTLVVVLLGGGIAFFCAPEGAPLPYHLLGLCRIDGAIVNPPVASYLFQHPWTLGLPLTAVLLLLTLETNGRRPGALGVVAGVMLFTLAISQIVLFATVGAALVASAFFNRGRLAWRQGVPVLLGALVATVVATQVGGVFAPAPDSLGGDLLLHVGMADSFTGTLHWHMATFGLLLPLGLVGLLLMPRMRLLTLLMVAGSLGVINAVRHAHSWDIAKFATVTAVFLSLSSVASLLALQKLRRRGRAYLGVALALTLAGGISFLMTFAGNLEGIPANLYHGEPQVLSDADVDVVNWLRPRVRDNEITYRRFPEVSGYAQRAGLAQPWVDNMVARHGYSPARIDRRMDVLTRLPESVVAYREEGIRYLVVAGEERRLVELSNRWTVGNEARVVFRSGPLFVLDISP